VLWQGLDKRLWWCPLKIVGVSSGSSRIFCQPGRIYQSHAPARTWNTNMSTTVVMTTLHYGHYQHNPTRVPSHFFTISVMHPAELPLSVLSCSISISTKSRLKIQNLFSNIEFNVTMLYIYIRFCSNFAIVAKIIA